MPQAWGMVWPAAAQERAALPLTSAVTVQVSGVVVVVPDPWRLVLERLEMGLMKRTSDTPLVAGPT